VNANVIGQTVIVVVVTDPVLELVEVEIVLVVIVGEVAMRDQVVHVLDGVDEEPLGVRVSE
jgi:hypothetical protein